MQKKSILSVLIGAVILIASCSSSSNPSKGNLTDGTSKEVEGHKLSVMAYNIHHANPPSKPGYIDIDAIVGVIRDQDPDIVALQEVDVKTKRSNNIDEAKEIAGKLDMEVFFGKAIDYQGGEYGVAILSKYPLSEQVVHKLPTQPASEPRILATAKVQLPDGSNIRFGSTHLDFKRDPVNRKAQINRILELAKDEQLPFVIAGDFNAAPDSDVIGLLDSQFQRTCVVCPPTIPVNDPVRAIDFIAYKHPSNKFSVVDHKVIDEKYASDHLPVIAIINIAD